MLRRRNDILWKTILEEVFDDLLRFLFPDADTAYDMGRGFEFLDKELAEMYPEVNKLPDTCFADKLVKVYTRSGKEEWMLLHIEIQGDTSGREAFAERMFRYFYRILDRYRKPVSAIAIFTGQRGQKMPGRYEYSYRNTSLIYKYQKLSILNYTDEDLLSIDNPFAIILMAAKAALLEGEVPEQFLMERKLLLARQLLQKHIPAKKIRAVFAFLNNYVRLEDATLNLNFTNQVDLFDNKHYNMGIIEYLQLEAREEGKEEGLEIGRKEVREKATLALLQKTEFSIERIADLVGESVDFVNKVKAQARLN